MASEIRRQVFTTTTRTWTWKESWGPGITDVTDWSVRARGSNLYLGRGAEEITMSTQVAKNVIQALTEALEGGE